MYATASDLASYLQKDLDTATATLAITVSSGMFSARAATMFAPTTVTYQVEVAGCRDLRLPYRPVISVQAVRVIGLAGTTTITDYTRIKTVLYRLIGFGVWGRFPPDMAEVDLTYGYATCPDDVKGAVLESAGMAYEHPDAALIAEAIDDYSIKTAATLSGFQLSRVAQDLADLYRGVLVA
jgi:hypothetical protein